MNVAARNRHMAAATRSALSAIGPLYQAAATAASRGATLAEAEALALRTLTGTGQRGPLLAMLRAIHEDVVPAFARAEYSALKAKQKARSGDASAERKAPTGDTWLGYVTRWLKLYGASLVKDMAKTSRAQVISAVRNVFPGLVEKGAGIEEIGRALRSEVDGLSRSRGLRVARTEVIRASNAGAVAGAEQAAVALGLVLMKEWIAASDARTRESHLEADGQRVGLDEPFVVGGESCQYPASMELSAAESVNCRCSVAMVAEE